MGQLQFHPAQQAVGLIGNQVAGQVAVPAEDRQLIAGRVAAGALHHVAAVTGGRRVEHAGAGMGQQAAIRGKERYGAHVLLFQRLGGNALEHLGVVVAHGRGHQGGQLFRDHLATLQELGLQVRELHPGEVAAQHQSHQAGWQQGQQQYAAFDSQFLEHATLLLPRCFERSTGTSVMRHLRSVTICRGLILANCARAAVA